MNTEALSPEDEALLAFARHCFAYDPKTGIFTHNRNSGAKARVGRPAGAMHANGHMLFTFKPYAMWAGPLAWLLHYGRLPKGRVWHKNGMAWDYRIDNLQEGSKPIVGL